MSTLKASASLSTAYRTVNTFIPKLDKCFCVIAKLLEHFHVFSLRGLRIVSPNL